MKRKIVAILVCMTMVFSLAACGSSSSSTEEAAEETEEEEEAEEADEAEETEDTAEATGEAKTIALVPPALTSPYYQSVISGAEEAVEELGWTLVTQAPETEDDYASQVQIVEDLITQGVDGIVICAINSEAITTAIKEANEADIPVVMFNIDEELTDCEVVTYVTYDQYDAGALVCEWVAENIGTEDIQVAIVEGSPSSQSTDRMGGFVDTAEANYPGIEVVASQDGEWLRESGMNAAANMLTANPDIDVIYGLSDEMALGALQAVNEAGSDAVCIGFDGNPNAVYSIQNGGLVATLSTNGTDTGYQTIYALNSYFNGEEVDDMITIEAVMVDETNASEYPSEAD